MTDVRNCWSCGDSLTKKPGRGRWPRYCSPRCKLDARPKIARGPRVADCLQCGVEFTATGRARFCSGACRTKFSRLGDPNYREKQRARNALRTPPRSFVGFILCPYCDEIACVRSVRAVRCRRTECRLAHRARTTAERRARQGRENYGYTEATAEAYHRRRALKKGATVEAFSHAEVFERDDWMCGICSEPVDRDAKFPDALSVSLDHIIPLALGGDHSRANTQCAHLGCNVRKGARAA